MNKIISMKSIVIEFICSKAAKTTTESFIARCCLFKFVYITKIRTVRQRDQTCEV